MVRAPAVNPPHSGVFSAGAASATYTTRVSSIFHAHPFANHPSLNTAPWMVGGTSTSFSKRPPPQTSMVVGLSLAFSPVSWRTTSIRCPEGDGEVMTTSGRNCQGKEGIMVGAAPMMTETGTWTVDMKRRTALLARSRCP